MAVLITVYLLLVFLVPVLLSALVSIRALPRTALCPHCTRETLALCARGGWPGRQALRILRLDRRWCFGCGWIGLARRAGRVRTQLPASPAGGAGAGEARALDLRSLRLDGRTWRVQLQCWRDARLCYGRLVFVDAAGRPWPDALQAFSAPTQLEVLGQALSIPDRALTSRLRQLITAD